MAEHPGIAVICRDRAPFFAEGASIGAPTAGQVADRFHLWRNLGEAAEGCVSRHRPCLRATFADPAPQAETPAPPASRSPRPTGHRFADRTRVKHATVHALPAAGHSRRAIQRQLGMTYRTVQRLANAAATEDLFHGQWRGRRTKLDDFKPYLRERWAEGCTNAWTLWARRPRRMATAAATEPCAPTSVRSVQSRTHRRPARPRPGPSPGGS
ncbi:hypothetical protein ACIQB5_23890 [Streptomyces sp. NPDC088560]|uniref:hypothetical protein n=1 Tax=Streptomyces sp. NPDC088560 TaxID=3365868 RepID=UPI00381A9D0B